MDQLKVKIPTLEETEDIVSLAVDGLLTDGAHHKQWYLEKIVQMCGIKLFDVKKMLNEDGYDFEKRIAP